MYQGNIFQGLTFEEFGQKIGQNEDIIQAPIVAAAFGMGAASYFSWKIENNFGFSKFMAMFSSKTDTQRPLNETATKIETDNSPKIVHQALVIGNDLSLLSSKWMEIHTLISSLSDDSGIKLPSIVVIGSQSSGKSSLLEALVGHEFLPKGHHMVTRRPIKLNLIHSTDKEEYGEFPELGFGVLRSFERIQQCLEELNLSVPIDEFVSDTPIILNIHSPNVPNLSLIDLPGYIQITTKDQPITLKEKISDICDKYITEPNLILAISAADVDLANSDSLRAAKLVDPKGVRTIGVLTKMDLVSPESGVKLLETQDYELPLGFVGVVCCAKPKQSEMEYFHSIPAYSKSTVGVSNLRNLLSSILESHLSKSLSVTKKLVEKEIKNTEYQLKAKFNDKTSKTYMLDALDSLKFKFQSFALSLRNSYVRGMINSFISGKVSEICRRKFWAQGQIELDDIQHDLDSLTKSGIGKLSVENIHKFVLDEVKNIVKQDPWNHHKISQEIIVDISKNLLEAEVEHLINQIEAMIQPLKSEVEFSSTEWMIGKKITQNLIKQEMKVVQEELMEILSRVPSKRGLRGAMRNISQTKYDYLHAFLIEDSKSNHCIELDAEASAALELEEYLFQLLNRDLSNRKTCNSAEECPDIYLSLIADRLISTASLFISHSLSTRIFSDLPRCVEEHFINLSEDQLIEFVKENPDMNQWVYLNHKNCILKQTLEKMNELAET